METRGANIENHHDYYTACPFWAEQSACGFLQGGECFGLQELVSEGLQWS
uniref:Uncharacterized protein n=1 Tax=Anguilla anguilla TaxID=7936 RepID=A0A0E9UUF3_ANGAN